MRWLGMILVALAMVAVAPMDAEAARGDLKDALSDVRDAIDEARDDEDCSKRKVITPLKDIKDDLRDLIDDGASARKIKRVLNDLRDVQDSAEDRCSRRVSKPIKSAVRSLKDARDDAEDGGGRDDRRDRAAKKPEGPKLVVVDCWNHSDPGCYYTRNGKHPMGKAAWQGFYNSVKSASPNVFRAIDTVKAGMSNNYITSKQMTLLAKELDPNVFKMLEVVEVCGPRVVDPQNGLGIGTIFGANKFKSRDAVKVMSSQPHGKKLPNVKLQ